MRDDPLRPSERRKEHRHVVIGIAVTLNGVPSVIVDISRSAVRLLRTEAFDPALAAYELVLSTPQGRRWPVTGHIIRSTAIEVVLGYTPPTPRWEAVLRAHDTFLQTQLAPIC